MSHASLTVGRVRRKEDGLAYLALMIAIAIIGVVAANAIQFGSVHSQRDKEDELLFIGSEFRQALHRYAEASPVGLPRAPQTLDELLRDPRYPGVVRHLRREYVDPLTGRSDWATVRDPQGRIVALHSNSSLKPIRIRGFGASMAYLEGKKQSYREWVFLGPSGNWQSR